MTGNISYLSDFEEINGGYVAFCGNPKGGKITSKDTECVVLSSDFKLPDENHVFLRAPRENNMYNVDLKNIVPSGDLTCLFAKATLYESNLWHRRLGHINFKTMNKLIKGNLVRGLPSKNRVAERKNRTLIEAVRTMLADSLLPILFWVEAVNTACYVQNKVLVTKPQNKKPYELLLGRTPSIGFMRSFGCLVTILNTLDPLGKFDGKADEGFSVRYSITSKAFRVFNSRNRIVLETLHINFLENQPNVVGSGPKWLFDIDTLTQSMNYQPVVAENQPNHNAGIQVNCDADADAAFDVKDNETEVLVSLSSSDKPKKHDEKAKREAKGKSHVDLSIGVRDLSDEFKEFSVNSTNKVNATSAPITAVGPNSTNSTNSFNAAGPSDNVVSLNFEISGKYLFVDPSQYPDDLDMPALEDIVYSDDEEDVGAWAGFSNLETSINTRSMARMVKEQGGLNQINDEDFYTCMFACFLSQEEPEREMCKAFEKLMKDKFQRSLMGELTFFLELQVKQKDDGLFISEDKYVAEILRKFGVTDGKLASTPIDTENPLLKDPDGEDVDVHIYRLSITAVSYTLMMFGLTKDAVNLMLLDDADGVDCLPNEDIFTELVRMGYEKPPPKLTCYKAFFSAQWTFLIHAIVLCLTAWNEFSSSMASAVICLATEDEDNNGVPAAPLPPSPTHESSPPPQEHIPSPPSAQPAPPLSPPQQQPTQSADTLESSMTLLNTLMKTCATLTQKVAKLEQDKLAQALKIVKLKQRVKKLEKKRKSKSSGLKWLRKVGTSQSVESSNDTIVDGMEDASKQGENYRIRFGMDADTQGRMEEDVTAIKEINAAEHTVLDDEEVTMTMAQTLIKMKAKKQRNLDEHMEKRMQDEEIEQAVVRERQEIEDLERAKVLQQQYDQKQEKIDWNVVGEQMQEKHLDNIKQYQSLKRKPISVAQTRKNMIVYLKNMDGYKIQHFKGMTYD
nr:hypothetical protein [Tanacetum cinerariifolium]